MTSQAEMVGNFIAMLEQSTADEREDGQLAYFLYRDILSRWAQLYDFPLDNVVAAFCALSPNNDYYGNLRSLTSLLEGIRKGYSVEQITVSTYGSAKRRAHRFALGSPRLFMAETRGPKTRAFYHNILYPETSDLVTVDGHVSAASLGLSAKHTMREAAVSSKGLYHRISMAIEQIARVMHWRPHQVQATVWLTRKRLLGIKSSPQFDFFRGKNGMRITPQEAPAYQIKGVRGA